jgi:PAS domain S-box-containing protein
MANATAIARIRTPVVERRQLAVVAVAVVALIAYISASDQLVADTAYVATSVIAATACLLAIRTGRHEVKGAWQAVAAALVLMSLGNALTFGRHAPALAEIGPFAPFFFLGAYIPLFVAAYRFGRGTHRSDRTVVLDAAIIGLVAVPFVWELLVEPNAPGVVTGFEPIMALAIPVIDVALVSLAAPMILFRHARSPSAVLFMAGLVTMGIGDSLSAVGTLNDAWTATLLPKVAWLSSYVLLAGAAFPASAAQLGAARDPRPGAGDSPRLVVLAAALIVSPLAALHEAVPYADGELVAFALFGVATAGLVALRLQQTIAQLGAADLRFRRFMSHDGFFAVIKDVAGRYVYMNSVAERMPRLGDPDWYGRTDPELFAPELAARRVQADANVRSTHEPIVDTVEVDGRVWHTERFPISGKGGELAVLGVDVTDQVRAEHEVRFQARLLESVRDAVVVVDPAGRFVYWNRGAEEIFGYGADEMLGQGITERLASGAGTQIDALWGAVRSGETELSDIPTTRRDGTALWLNARVSEIFDEAGEPAGYLAIVKDVTARKSSELELRRLGLAIDNANDAVIVTDGEDRVTYVNPAFERMTGFAAAEVIGQRPSDHPAGHAFGRALAHARLSREGWRGDLVDRRRDGSDLVAETSISPIDAGGGAESGFVTIKRDVTRDRATERATERRARERLLISETLASLHAGDSPEATGAAVCSQIVKLPEFALATIITFGVDDVARVLAQHHGGGPGVVGIDLPAERSAYLHGRAAAGPWIERWTADSSHPYSGILTQLGIIAHAYAPMTVEGRPIGLLIAGSNVIDAVERLTERLPALVEFAAIATTLLAQAVSSRNQAAAAKERVRRVIESKLFQIYFQPIVDLKDGVTRGYEALTRFDDGRAPDLQFEEAHDLGLGLELEAACLGAALDVAPGLPAEAWLNVNVSPEVILSGLVDSILPVTGRSVVLEITEHQAITDYQGFRDAVAPIRNRVRIAVDDAGAGFASLRHIVELAPAMVKLDRSLIAGIATDVARQGAVAGMLRFAETAGIVLVAEGIETGAELEVLRRVGIPLGQGYALGGPMPLLPERQPTEAAPRRGNRRSGHRSMVRVGEASIP